MTIAAQQICTWITMLSLFVCAVCVKIFVQYFVCCVYFRLALFIFTTLFFGVFLGTTVVMYIFYAKGVSFFSLSML